MPEIEGLLGELEVNAAAMRGLGFPWTADLLDAAKERIAKVEDEAKHWRNLAEDGGLWNINERH